MGYADKERRAEYQRNHYTANKEKYKRAATETRQRRKQFFQSLKESSPCVDCNKHFPHYVMEWDHVPGRGEKFAPVGRMISEYGKARILEEIAKCDLLCGNCHRIRTWQRNQ